jgi:hypothetical protein
MREFLAVNAADRISRTAITLAGVLCGVLVFFVAVPLAVSSPYPSPKEGSWVIHRSAMHIAAPITLPMAEDLSATVERDVATVPQGFTWNFVSLPVYDGPSLFTPAMNTADADPEVTGSIASVASTNTAANTGYSLASLTSTEVKLDDLKPQAAPAPAKRSKAGTIEEVNDYLWEVYQRAPTKKDGAGDFTWKDPAAAKRMNMTMPVYVISGMDADFREQLYHAGHAMDEAGIQWSMLSAFRDDYRQSIASGLKAGNSNSLHGGKARTGGYGHGQAIDITNANGDDGTVYRWIDRNGAKYGLFRPMPGYDPAHIQPRESWHKLATTFRANRVKLAEEEQKAAAKAKTAAATSETREEAKAE